MPVLFVALAVVPAALMVRPAHSGARALFPTVPPWVTIIGTVIVAGMAPVLYFLIGERTRLLLADAGVAARRHEAFALAIAVLVIAVLVAAVIVVPRHQRREADAWLCLDEWRRRTAASPDLYVGRVQHYDGQRRRREGWATIVIGDAPWEVWLDAPAWAGEFVLLRCHPYQPTAQVIKRLDQRASAEAVRHVERVPHGF